MYRGLMKYKYYWEKKYEVGCDHTKTNATDSLVTLKLKMLGREDELNDDWEITN